MKRDATDKPLQELDQRSLIQINALSGQVRGALLSGIATLRNLDPGVDTQLPKPLRDSLSRLGKLTLAWDELRDQAQALIRLSDEEVDRAHRERSDGDLRLN
ncbi:MAG: hypothetical protein H7831_02550 [Magnetococcus sp. WYHC-3]